MKRKITIEEISFIVEVIGTKYRNRSIDFSKISFLETPKFKTSFSLPNGIIVTEDFPTMANPLNKSLLVHEVFHQFQFQSEGPAAIRRLLFSTERLIGVKAYHYEPDRVTVLDDIEKYEARAQFVQDFAFLYAGYSDALKSADKNLAGELKARLRPFADILCRSGFNSKAIDELNGLKNRKMKAYRR
jgi:hypothetical protein